VFLFLIWILQNVNLQSDGAFWFTFRVFVTRLQRHWRWTPRTRPLSVKGKCHESRRTLDGVPVKDRNRFGVNKSFSDWMQKARNPNRLCYSLLNTYGMPHPNETHPKSNKKIHTGNLKRIRPVFVRRRLRKKNKVHVKRPLHVGFVRLLMICLKMKEKKKTT